MRACARTDGRATRRPIPGQGRAGGCRASTKAMTCRLCPMPPDASVWMQRPQDSPDTRRQTSSKRSPMPTHSVEVQYWSAPAFPREKYDHTRSGHDRASRSKERFLDLGKAYRLETTSAALASSGRSGRRLGRARDAGAGQKQLRGRGQDCAIGFPLAGLLDFSSLNLATGCRHQVARKMPGCWRGRFTSNFHFPYQPLILCIPPGC
jgi:hypothetical protein